MTVHVVLRTGEKNRDVSPTNAYLLLLNGMGPNDPSDARRSAPFWSARNVTSLSILVVGVAAAGTGLAFGAQSRSQADKAASLRAAVATNYACASGGDPTCQALSAAVDGQNRNASASEGLLVTGGVLVAAATATWFLWPRAHKERRSEAWMAPDVGAGQVGVRAGGTF